jgi:hypothetical protein
MPLSRKALLIANPGEQGQENYCKGVYVDIANYQRFLASAVGGHGMDQQKYNIWIGPLRQT